MQGNNSYFHLVNPFGASTSNSTPTQGYLYDNEEAEERVYNNPSATIVANGTDLRSVEEIPKQYRSLFSNYLHFNVIQSQVFNCVYLTDQSLVVSAPTGSGKTVVFELAIVRFLENLKTFNDIPYKIVYVAPMKALCEERLVDWFPKFSNLGLNCILVTGDTDNIDFKNLTTHNLIITTPEKWDTLTRKWRDCRSFVSSVKLFMIDEVHLLNDDNRGPTVEVIVSRMKTIQSSLEYGLDTMNLRFIAVSATIPNVEDVAEWLSLPKVPAISYKFGNDMRPIKLKKVVYGYNYNSKLSNPFKFDLMLNYKLQSIILQHSEGKPTLIFCATRKNVEMTTKHLAEHLTINLNTVQKQTLNEASMKLSQPKLKVALCHGIGFHHAGLSKDDRRIAEDVFRSGTLPVLIATSTLAMGVNLPAHLVIIKSTKHYQDGRYQDYSESMILQMIGRAGRAQFDTSATAVILTTKLEKEKYENMLEGVQPVESYLHRHLTEHLNAEVVLRTITDLSIALEWLTYSFLYIRAKKNPKHYGLPCGLTLTEIDKKLLEMCQIQVNKLVSSGMLKIDEDVLITATEKGELMAKYYITLETMKLFGKVSGQEALSQILSVISKCEEFSEMYLRVNDKKTLNLLNKCHHGETIRFPFSQKISTVDMKINCIVQAVFGNLRILEPSLENESQKIMRIGERVSNCLCEYLSTMKNTFSALLNALILVKCFHTRLWENSPYVSKQLPGIGSAYSVTLAEADKTSFEALANTNPRDIERIINRKPPMGNEIRGAVEHLPNYKLDLTCLDNSYVDVKITLKNVELIKSHSSVKKESIMTLLVGDTDNCVLLHKSFKHSDFIQTPSVENRIKLADNYHEEISAHFISADWVGIDCQDSLTLPYNTTSKGSQEKKKPMEVSAGRSNGKKSPHIQMIVDKYFTKNKGTDGRNRKRQVKSNPPIESHDDADLVNITINNNCNFLQPGITEATALQTSIEESLKKCESNPNFLLTKSNTQFPKRTSYCPTPRRNVETNKSISTVTSQTENNLNKYKLPDMNDTLIFDSSLSLNEQNRNLDKFKVSSHTKFENVSSGGTLWCPSKNKNFYETTLNGEDSLDDEMSKMPLSVVGTPSNEPNGAQKSITWSSPLVISPTVKYSPAVGKSKTTSTTAFSYNDHYERFNVTDDRNLTDGSFTQKMLRPTLRDNLSTINCPLSDKDYYKHQREKDNSSSNDKELYEHLRDSIASTSFLETMNILKPTPTASYKKLSTTQKPRSVIDDYLKMMSTVTKEPKLGKDRPSQSKISAHTQTTISLPSTTKDASTSPIRTKQDEFLNIGSLKYYNVTNENKPFLGSNFETLPRQFLTDNRELFSNYEPYDDINISQNESVTCGNSYKSQTEINMPNEYLHPYWSDHSNVLRKSNSNFMGQSQIRNIKRENPFIDDSYSKRIRRGNTLRPLNNIVPVGAVRYPSVPGQLVGNFDRSHLDFSNDTNNTYQLRNQLQVQSTYANRIYNRNMAMVPNQNHDAYYNVRRNITTNAAGQPQRPLMNRRFMPVETFSNMSNPLFNDSISGIINAGLYEDLDEASEDLEM